MFSVGLSVLQPHSLVMLHKEGENTINHIFVFSPLPELGYSSKLFRKSLMTINAWHLQISGLLYKFKSC